MDPQALAGMSADVSDSSDECESPLLQQLEQLRQQTHSERRRRLLSLEQAASHREQELGMDAEVAEGHTVTRATTLGGCATRIGTTIA